MFSQLGALFTYTKIEREGKGKAKRSTKCCPVSLREASFRCNPMMWSNIELIAVQKQLINYITT